MTQDTEDVVVRLRRKLVNPDGPAGADLIQSLSDRIDVLTQALEPFARIAELREGYNDKDDTIVCVNITAVRNARAALHQEGIAPGEER